MRSVKEAWRSPGPLTESRLEAWGRELGEAAQAGNVFVCLQGELGAGKSTLARAMCRGAGVRGPVPSPTFTLINRYVGSDGRPVHHADLYRLEGPEGLADMGWQELLQTEGAVLLEWPERAADHLPSSRWDIRLELTPDPDLRTVTARAVGDVPPIPAVPPEPENDAC